MQWTDNGAGWAVHLVLLQRFGAVWRRMGSRVIYWSRVDGSDGVSDEETAFDYVVIVLDRNMGDLTGYVGSPYFRTRGTAASTGSRSAP